MTESERLVDSLCFCVIDLETTGGNAQKDRIIEIGMVKVKDRKVISEKSFLINPLIAIPEFIQKLTNIKQADVKDAPLIEDVIDQVIKFIDKDIIVAHNTSFDVPFLNGVLARLKRAPLENKVICTNVMTKYLIPEILNSNLNYMSKIFEIEHSKAHRAADDAKATAHLLIKYLSIFAEKGIKKVNQLYYPRNRFELDRIHFDKAHSSQQIMSQLSNYRFSVTVTVKGQRGLILAVIPLLSPNEECDFVEELLKDLDWEIITVKMLHPFLDGLLLFNNHFSKYPTDIGQRIKDYLTKRVGQAESDLTLQNLDFVVSHHLVAEQVISYNFLNLNTSTRSLFKIPAQKKKFFQFLNSQINRFENQQKGRRKNTIHPELVPLICAYLSKEKSSGDYLLLDPKMVKSNRDTTMKLIERFVAESSNRANFPREHL